MSEAALLDPSVAEHDSGSSSDSGNEMLIQLSVLAAAGLAFFAFFAMRSRRHAKALQQCEAEAVQLRRKPQSFHASELLVYNGKSAERPLLLAIKGRVLDVREGADYYGPEGPYKVMAGCDASKAFAMMSLKAEDAIPDVSDVPPEHLKILDDWYDKLTQKYPTVGCLEGNTFGYGLGDIDIAASEAIAELAKEERLKAKDE